MSSSTVGRRYVGLMMPLLDQGQSLSCSLQVSVKNCFLVVGQTETAESSRAASAVCWNEQVSTWDRRVCRFSLLILRKGVVIRNGRKENRLLAKNCKKSVC